MKVFIPQAVQCVEIGSQFCSLEGGNGVRVLSNFVPLLCWRRVCCEIAWKTSSKISVYCISGPLFCPIIILTLELGSVLYLLENIVKSAVIVSSDYV